MGGVPSALDEAQRAELDAAEGSGPRRSPSQTRHAVGACAPSFPRGESQRRAAPEL